MKTFLIALLVTLAGGTVIVNQVGGGSSAQHVLLLCGVATFALLFLAVRWAAALVKGGGAIAAVLGIAAFAAIGWVGAQVLMLYGQLLSPYMGTTPLSDLLAPQVVPVVALLAVVTVVTGLMRTALGR